MHSSYRKTFQRIVYQWSVAHWKKALRCQPKPGFNGGRSPLACPLSVVESNHRSYQPAPQLVWPDRSRHPLVAWFQSLMNRCALLESVTSGDFVALHFQRVSLTHFDDSHYKARYLRLNQQCTGGVLRFQQEPLFRPSFYGTAYHVNARHLLHDNGPFRLVLHLYWPMNPIWLIGSIMQFSSVITDLWNRIVYKELQPIRCLLFRAEQSGPWRPSLEFTYLHNCWTWLQDPDLVCYGA